MGKTDVNQELFGNTIPKSEPTNLDQLLMEGTPRKILVAEDDTASRRIISSMLQKWGYEVLSAEDGAVAWKLYLEHEDIQLIVCDWMMPEIDGIELCKLIRGKKGRRYAYFILLTAKSQADDIVSGIETGADDFITKPFNQPELKVRILAGERVINLENELESKIEIITKANQRIHADLEAAVKIQQSFLPAPSGEFPGLAYSSFYIPCEEIGGDLFNLVPLDDTYVGVYIFDVSGHGVPAALQSVAMGRLLSNFDPSAGLLLNSGQNGQPATVVQPREVTDQLNAYFQSSSSKGDFITFMYGIINMETGRFTYTRAGHPAPIVISQNRVVHLKDKGDIPIGIIPQYGYIDNKLDLKSGDRIFLYTDGVPEAGNRDGVRFGEVAMSNFLAETSGKPIEESVAGLLKILMKWQGESQQADDMSILGIEVKL
jgi:sigma-B regulation protein RsbU (phosphoserine phosphatase)